MNADEIVRALKCTKNEHDGCQRCQYRVTYKGKHDHCDTEKLERDAADLIGSLQAQLSASQRRADAARNELCLKCGLYHDAHNGACDGCRWKGEAPNE